LHFGHASLRSNTSNGVSPNGLPHLGQEYSRLNHFFSSLVCYLAQSQFFAGKADSGRRSELWLRAEPTLKSYAEGAPADGSDDKKQLAAKQLREISNIKGGAPPQKQGGPTK